MDYLTALKKINTPRKSQDIFMVIKFSYDNTIILPHKDGLALLQALQNSERLTGAYGTPPKIEPIERDCCTVHLMSQKEYEQHKIAALLDCTLEEVKASELEFLTD